MIAASGGLFIGDLYRDTPYFTAQARAQDLVNLAIVLPALIITALLAHRGSARALLIWLGGMIYLVYSYVIAAFDVQFNAFFLIYVALLGCSLYALILSLATLDAAGIKARFADKAPVKVASAYLAVLAVLFYVLWLSEIVPAILSGKVPQSLQDNGTPTNAVHVLDMAWILPAFAIAAVSLWRKQAWGYVLAGALLSYVVLLVTAVLSMVLFMAQEGFPVVLPQVVIFTTLFVVSLGILMWYLKGAASPPISR
jgi:hypothetical protein